jgi:hypothetical protein
MKIPVLDHTKNLWVMYPGLKAYLPNIYKLDAEIENPSSKDRGSRIGWSLIYLLHPDSDFFNTPREEAMKYISKDIMNESPTSEGWDFVFQVASKFKEGLLTPAGRAILDWKIKFEERAQFLESVPYDENTFEMLDKMLSNTKKMFDMLRQAQADYSKEKAEEHTEGGAVESLSDKGDLG